MPLLAAMGTDVEEWPPYLSNFVFELWEVQPPAAPVAASASGREAPNSAAPEVTAADPEQRFAVKVRPLLFNGWDGDSRLRLSLMLAAGSRTAVDSCWQCTCNPELLSLLHVAYCIRPNVEPSSSVSNRFGSTKRNSCCPARRPATT